MVLEFGGSIQVPVPSGVGDVGIRCYVEVWGAEPGRLAAYVPQMRRQMQMEMRSLSKVWTISRSTGAKGKKKE